MVSTAVDIPQPTGQRKKNKQKGYSIVELSIALAIISIILVTALTGVQRILRSNSTNDDLRNINLLAAKISIMLATQSNTSGITQANLASLRMFDNFKVSGGTVNNAFGGTITVVPNSVQLDTVPINGGMMIYSSKIPPEVCSDYISGLNSIASHLSATNAAVPSVAGDKFGTVVKSSGKPITIANLATACTAAAGETITVAALLGS